MFVAWRDLRFAKGRFALMGTVVVLITLLVGLLSGLTAGPGPGEHLGRHRAARRPPRLRRAARRAVGVSFTGSTVGAEQRRAAGPGAPGVDSAEPLGISTLNAAAGHRTAAVSAFAVRPGSGLAPGTAVDRGTVVLSEKAADESGRAARGPCRRSGTR